MLTIEAMGARLHLFAPLRSAGFRRLWCGMAVSLVGDGIMLVALAWQVYQLSNAPTALGLTAAAMAVPHVLLLLPGGAVGDRFDRRRVLLCSDMVRMGCVAAMGALSLLGVLRIWHMALIAACYGAGTAFFGPSFDAIVPDLVPTEQLPQANSLDQFVRPIAARLLGPALGGWIIATIGVGWAFVADAGSFAFSAVCLILLGSIPIPQHASADGTSMGREIKEGLRYVRSQTWLWATLAAAAISYLLFLGPSEVLLPYVVKNMLGGNAAQLGTVFAVGGLGATAAAVIMGQRGTPKHSMTFLYLAWTVSTLMVCGYGLARASWHLMAVCFAFNLCESAGLIVWLTVKQSRVPARLLGRVSSLDWFVSVGLMPLSYALAGPVAGLLGVRPTLIWAGALGAVVTAAFLLVPGVRSTQPQGRANAISTLPSIPVHDLQDKVTS